MSKFKVGDKVVPVSKSAGMLTGLEHSNAWKDAIKIKQPYLYISFIRNKLVDCCVSKGKPFGDCFLESDLIPYEEVQARIEPAEKPPVWYTLPAPVEEKVEPDYKGFYEFTKDHMTDVVYYGNFRCNAGCEVKKSGFCTGAYGSSNRCEFSALEYAENKFIKRG